MLQQELQEKNFDFSLNTLQYILAGKTKRTRGIVLDLLNHFSEDENFNEMIKGKGRQILARKGRPPLATRVAEAWTLLEEASGKEKEAKRKEFLALRKELIKKCWSIRHAPKKPTRRQTHRRSLEENLDPSEYSEQPENSNDADVAFDVHDFGRLVS